MPNPATPRNLIGPAVARHRTAKGWSQAMLATKCQVSGWDISRSIIAAIEGRVRWVGDWEALRLASILQVSVQELFPDKADWTEFTDLVRGDEASRPAKGRTSKKS